MARFLSINTGRNTIYVNPDRVLMVKSSGIVSDESVIVFDQGHEIIVPEGARELARMLEHPDD